MSATSIEWTDVTWNPVRGCARVSPGCTHCYAEVMAARFSDPGMWGHGFAERTEHGARWTRKVAPVPEKLAEPLHWTKPRKVFVNSTSDLFHEDVPDAFIAAVFGVMAACPQHMFQVLTKRPERMRAWFDWAASRPATALAAGDHEELLTECVVYDGDDVLRARDIALPKPTPWPLPNVWLGVTVEDQQRADERIPQLLAVPAAVRFLSCEPLLEEVDLRIMLGGNVRWDSTGREVGRDELHWVIVGGESGPGARPFDLAWARSIVAQCRAAGTPVFVKQLGARPEESHEGWDRAVVPLKLAHRKGANVDEWPEDLRVREFPKGTR